MSLFERNRQIAMLRHVRALPKVSARGWLDWPRIETLAFTILAGFVAGLLI